MVCRTAYQNQNVHIGKKRLLFENGIYQILIRQLKLYSVMCNFIQTCILSPNVKAALIWGCFSLTCTHSLVGTVVKASNQSIVVATELILSFFFDWLKPLTDEGGGGGGKLEYLENTLKDRLQKMKMGGNWSIWRTPLKTGCRK